MADAKRKIEPTLDEPTSDHAIEFQKDFDKEMIKKGIGLIEVDKMLTEKEESLKKKIFNLSKMEALVHSDPKLSAVYDEMAENGEEKYGYHYNETIMNMIFNDYVLNSSKYLQKYKQAIPKEKKRRDKSGINALRKDAEEIEKKREQMKKEKAQKKQKKEVNESTPAANAGAYFTKAGDTESYESNQINTDEEWDDLNNPETSEIAKEKKMKDKSKSKKNPIFDKTNFVGGSDAKPSFPGGKIVKNNNNTVLNESVVDDLDTAKNIAQQTSKEEGVVQHVNLASNGKYVVGDWYDDDSTVASFENGRDLNEDKVEETSTTGSVGGAGMGSGGYSTPRAWSTKGNLTSDKKKKNKKDKPYYKGGKVVGESNYLTDPSGFEKYFNMLNENFDQSGLITTLDQYKELVQQRRAEGKKIDDNDFRRIGGQALYAIAEKVADRLVPGGIGWNGLPDINSLWDYIDENGGMSIKEFKEAVKEAVNDRLSEEGFDLDMLQEKAKSKAQQKFMGMVHAYQKGELSGDEVSDEVKKAAKSMTDKEAEDFASTKHKNIPDKVDEEAKEVSATEIYNDEIKKGKSEDEAAEMLLDVLTNGMWAAWDNNKIEQAKQKIINKLGGKKKGIDEILSLHDAVEYVSDREGEEPFEMHGIKWQFVNAKYPDGKVDIGVYRFGQDVVYDYNRWREEMGIDESSQLNEHHLTDRKDKVMFIINAMMELQEPHEDIESMHNFLDGQASDEEVDQEYLKIEDTLRNAGIEPTTIDINEIAPAVMALGGAAAHGAGEAIGGRVADKVGLEEHHLNTREEKLAFLQKVSSKLMPEPMISGYIDMLSDASDEKIHDAYLTAEKALREKGIDPATITETIIEDNPDSMKIQPPITNSQGGGEFPSGMQIAKGSMAENYEKLLDDYNKDIFIFENIMKNLKGMNEDKKHSALVLKDRLGKDNQKNFKKDLKHSGTKEMVDTMKELEWKDQQTEVGEDPQKLGKDIEKEELKNTDGEAFKDEGNSTNNEGDEIPKRNLTDEEGNEVDLYRKGLGDYVYDNEPDERYKERMKRDMGEEEYKKREERMKFNSDAPMYNKDSQPVDDGIEKAQFDKAKTGWNERFGVKESIVTGKYKDELGKTRLIEVKFSDVKEVKTVETDDWFELNFDGLGNTYDSKVNVNESVKDAFDNFKFYTDGSTVFVKHVSNIITESEQKEEKSPVNEQFNKMKHLFGYDSNKYVNTKGNKNANDIIKIRKK